MPAKFTRFPVGVYLCCGRRGMGKTTLQRQLIADMLADGRTIAVIHDPRGQYPGAIVWDSVAAFRAAKTLQGDVHLFCREKATAVVALAVQLAEHGERVLLVIDEMDQVCRSSQWFDDPPTEKGEEPEHGHTFNVCHYGRHIGRPPGDTTSREHGVTLLGSCRRPTNIHVDLGELGERYFFFCMTGRNSVRWVAETTESDELAMRVRRLPPYKHIVYDPADTSDLEHATKRPTRAPAATRARRELAIAKKADRRR